MLQLAERELITTKMSCKERIRNLNFIVSFLPDAGKELEEDATNA